MGRLMTLIAGDGRNVARDPMLAYMPLIPLALTLGLRLIVPRATDLLASRLDVAAYHDVVTAFLLLLTPLLVGMLAGFVLLDERDENVLLSIAVTPLGRTRFLLYRLALATALSFVLDILLVGLLALVPLRLAALIPVALIGSTEAPLLALFMATFAGNKVEGLVLAKAGGLLFLAPVAVVFLPSGWGLLAGVMPTYWVTRSFLAIHRPGLGYSWSLLAAAAYHGALLWALARAFNRRAE